jgi:membrane protein
VAWVIVLLGAVIAAYLPSLLAGVERRSGLHGIQFRLALETLQQLDRVRGTKARGLTMEQLCALLRVDALQLEPVLETLCQLDWTGLLQEELTDEAARNVLLVDPDSTPLAPLLDALLLKNDDATQNFWKNASWSLLKLRAAL